MSGTSDSTFHGLPSAPDCPFCRGSETELMHPFGSHASVATYWCRRCRSPFEFLKWGGEGGGEPAGHPDL